MRHSFIINLTLALIMMPLQAMAGMSVEGFSASGPLSAETLESQYSAPSNFDYLNNLPAAPAARVQELRNKGMSDAEISEQLVLEAERKLHKLRRDENPDYVPEMTLTAPQQRAEIRRGIQLRPFGGIEGTFQYRVKDGSCTVNVNGLVIGSTVGTCVVEAYEVWPNPDTGTLREYTTNTLSLEFYDPCPNRDVPMTLSVASSTVTVGQTTQITAQGGGEAHCLAGNTDYLFVGPHAYCRVTEDGVASATRAGTCEYTVYAGGLRNSAYEGTITVTFEDDESLSNQLAITVADENPAPGTATQIVATGAGSRTVIYSQDGGCLVNSAGSVNSYENRTCRVYASAVGGDAETSNSICVRFGIGSVVPPEGCRPPNFSTGVWTLVNPRGTGTVGGTRHQVGYQGGGDALGLITWSLAEENADCNVSRYDGQVTATSDTVCKVRAYSGGNQGYANNILCVPFGTATLDGACVIENAGGTSADDFGVTLSGSATTNPIGGSVTLTATGLGLGGTADWDIDPDNWACTFSGGNASKIGLTSVTLSHRPNQVASLCRVKAWRQGLPDSAVYRCIAFGEITMDDPEACTGSLPDRAIEVNTSSDEPAVGETVTISVTKNRNDGFLMIRPVSNNANCVMDDGNFITTSRTITTSIDQTCAVRVDWRVDNDDVVTETVCLRFGDGSTNSNCPEHGPLTTLSASDFSLSVSTDRAAVNEPVTVTLNFPDGRETLPVDWSFRWYAPQGSAGDCTMDTETNEPTTILNGTRNVNCSVHAKVCGPEENCASFGDGTDIPFQCVQFGDGAWNGYSRCPTQP